MKKMRRLVLEMYKIEKENVTELLKKLVSIRSPYFHEDEIMEYVYNWF